MNSSDRSASTSTPLWRCCPSASRGLAPLVSIGDGQIYNRVVSLTRADRDYLNPDGWTIDEAYHGSMGTPGTQGNQFCGAAPFERGASNWRRCRKRTDHAAGVRPGIAAPDDELRLRDRHGQPVERLLQLRDQDADAQPRGQPLRKLVPDRRVERSRLKVRGACVYSAGRHELDAGDQSRIRQPSDDCPARHRHLL